MIERLASWSRGCLTMQGYGDLSDKERRGLWLGLRFSTGLCFAGIALGCCVSSPLDGAEFADECCERRL